MVLSVGKVNKSVFYELSEVPQAMIRQPDCVWEASGECGDENGKFMQFVGLVAILASPLFTLSSSAIPFLSRFAINTPSLLKID